MAEAPTTGRASLTPLGRVAAGAVRARDLLRPLASQVGAVQVCLVEASVRLGAAESEADVREVGRVLEQLQGELGTIALRIAAARGHCAPPSSPAGAYAALLEGSSLLAARVAQEDVEPPQFEAPDAYCGSADAHRTLGEALRCDAEVRRAH